MRPLFLSCYCQKLPEKVFEEQRAGVSSALCPLAQDVPRMFDLKMLEELLYVQELTERFLSVQALILEFVVLSSMLTVKYGPL